MQKGTDHSGPLAPNGSGRRLRVMLISEGNYPYHWGGVSTWCHYLINELKDIDFIQYSIIDDATLPLKFTLPKNVVEFRGQPLWGIHQVLETRGKLQASELIRIRRRTTAKVIKQQFLPYFQAFITNLFTGNEAAIGQANLLHHLHRFFLEYDYDTAMRSRAAWHCFMETIGKYGPQVMQERGYEGETISLAEATKAIQWLYHWLIPLATPIPKVDVAHAAMAGTCTLVAVMAKIEHGSAFLLTEHGVYLRERYFFEAEKSSSLFLKCFSLFFALRLTELSYGLADQIAPCCNFNQRWELRNGADPTLLNTIYYGLDSSKFTPSGRPPNDPLVVVWMGRIDPLKDLFTLLHAAALVHKERPEIQFRLFGSAPPGNEAYQEQCLALWRELGLEETVTFAGFRSDTNNAYNEGDIFALTSKSEAFPFVNLEAMLCERPVVSSAVGGVPEQLDGCGFAVEPRNPQAMADAILRLASDPELCATFGREGRRKVTTEFSIERFSGLYAASYQALTRLTKPAHQNVSVDVEAQALRSLPQYPAHDQIHTNSNGKDFLGTPALTTIGNDKHNDGKRVKELPGVRINRLNGNGGNNLFSKIKTIGVAWLPEPARTLASNVGSGMREMQVRSLLTSALPLNTIYTHPIDHEQGNSSQPFNPENGFKNISELADEVIERDPKPIDSLEVTALLEAQGITDSIASQRYGLPNTFELGETVLAYMRKTIIPQRLQKKSDEPDETLLEKWSDFGRGPLSLVPIFLIMLMISSLALFAGWGFSMVMTLSMGMTCSMIVNSGLLQAVGRRLSIYQGMRNEKMARLFLIRATFIFLLIDLASAALTTTFLLMIRILSIEQCTVFFLAFLGMASLWLLGGELAVIGRALWLGLSLTIGLIVGVITSQLVLLLSYRVAYLTGQYLAWGCAIGYLTALVLLIFGINRIFPQHRSKGDPGIKLRLPSFVFLASEAAPYFIYGALSMIFILIPHLMGLSGHLPAGMERSTAITQFELVYTIAMFPMALTGGINERTLRLFWKMVPKSLAASPIHQVSNFQKGLIEYAHKNRNNYLAWLILISLMIDDLFLLFLFLSSTTIWPHSANLLELVILFQGALVTFDLLALTTYNVMYCLTLGNPWNAARIQIYGLLIMLITGVPAITYDYRFSGAAFFIGSVILYLLSKKQLRSTFAESAYHFTFSI